jgi:hypothetical protein
LPALTSTALTFDPVAARCRRPTAIGAATSWFDVNMTAAPEGASHTASATSGLPLALMPAFADDH